MVGGCDIILYGMYNFHFNICFFFIDKVVALFPYTANNPDELSFLKDDIISVTARDEPSWWRGELNGVSGLFPSNYVGPLQCE